MGTCITYGGADRSRKRSKDIKPVYYRGVAYGASRITEAQRKRIENLLWAIEAVGLHKYCEMPEKKIDASRCIKGLQEYCRRHNVFLLLKEGKKYAVEQQPHQGQVQA